MLTVLTPATSSALTTTDAVKEVLDITGTSKDAKIANLIARASSVIAGHCGRVMGVQRVQETFRMPYCVPRWGLPVLPLTLASPARAIESVVTDGNTLSAGTDYEYDLDRGQIWRLSGNARINWIGAVTTVVYSTGWMLPGDSPRDLPAAIEEQAIALVASAYAGGSFRDPAIASDTSEGIGTIRYFDRGAGGMRVDANMADALRRYVVWTI